MAYGIDIDDMTRGVIYYARLL